MGATINALLLTALLVSLFSLQAVATGSPHPLSVVSCLHHVRSLSKEPVGPFV